MPKTRPPTPDWNLEFVRLLAFPAIPAVFSEQHWWRDIGGEQPADFVSTRKIHFCDERGSFQGLLLALTVNLTQVIWEARSRDMVDASGNFPTIGVFREKINWFVELVRPWLKTSCPPIVRLAFSAKLLHPTINKEEAYRVLGTHLRTMKFKNTYPDDFLLQLNRRTDSTIVDGLPINRVCTWSKMNVSIISEPGKPFQWLDRCYSALELDINTAPEKPDVLPRQLVPQLFEELSSLGIKIAEHGDNP